MGAVSYDLRREVSTVPRLWRTRVQGKGYHSGPFREFRRSRGFSNWVLMSGLHTLQVFLLVSCVIGDCLGILLASKSEPYANHAKHAASIFPPPTPESKRPKPLPNQESCLWLAGSGGAHPLSSAFAMRLL